MSYNKSLQISLLSVLSALSMDILAFRHITSITGTNPVVKVGEIFTLKIESNSPHN